MSLSSDLGEQKKIELTQGTVRYRERGAGPPIVFIHGLLVNGDLWRKVVPQLADRYRCITPDLPLGAHEIPMKPDADLSIPGVARLVSDFCTSLGLEQPTLVANDTGGAITQLVMTEHPKSVGRVVLTSCDCFENFLPALFRPLQVLAHVPPLLTLLLQPLRLASVRRLPLGFGWLAKRPIDPEIEAGYAAQIFAQPAVRRDVYKVLRDISPKYTQRAAERLGEFDGPLLVAWAADDRFFPEEHGRRLAQIVPDGRFVSIDDSYTFVSEDQPDALAKQIRGFLEESPEAR
jgi:pimeloyl-ACP methyl ester carboxylesterase